MPEGGRAPVIHYDVRGTDGPWVVTFHASGMSGRQWRRLAERLEPGYRVASLDFLGSGGNPPWPPDEPFDFRQDVAAAREVLNALDGPAHLVGHSYGGLVALTAARLSPERVRSLAAYDPVAFGVLYGASDAVGLSDLDRVAQNPVFHDEAQGGQAAWFEAFVDFWNGPGAWNGLPPPARAEFLKVGRKVYREVRSLMEDRTPASAYACLAMPVLLLTGERSPLAAQRVVSLLAASLPQATLETVPKAGHMGPITHAGEVDGRIAGALKFAGPRP